MENEIDIHRMKIVMNCYDKLPVDLRNWISNLNFSLHDDHILRGEREIRKCKIYVDNGGRINYYKGNGQN